MTITARIPYFKNLSTSGNGAFPFYHPSSWTVDEYNLDSYLPAIDAIDLTGTTNHIVWLIDWCIMTMSSSGPALALGAPLGTLELMIVHNHWTTDKSDCISIIDTTQASTPESASRRATKLTLENWGVFTLADEQAVNHTGCPMCCLNFTSGATTDMVMETVEKVEYLEQRDFCVEAGRNSFMFREFNTRYLRDGSLSGQANWDATNNSICKLYTGNISANPSAVTGTGNKCSLVINDMQSKMYHRAIIDWMINTQCNTRLINSSSYTITKNRPLSYITETGVKTATIPTAQIMNWAPGVYDSSNNVIQPSPYAPTSNDTGTLHTSTSTMNPTHIAIRNRIYDKSNNSIAEFYTGGPAVMEMCRISGLHFCPSGLYITNNSVTGIGVGDKFNMCICPSLYSPDKSIDILYPGKGVAIKSSDRGAESGEHFSEYEPGRYREYANLHIFRAGKEDATIQSIRDNYTDTTVSSAHRPVLVNTYVP